MVWRVTWGVKLRSTDDSWMALALGIGTGWCVKRDRTCWGCRALLVATVRIQMYFSGLFMTHFSPPFLETDLEKQREMTRRGQVSHLCSNLKMLEEMPRLCSLLITYHRFLWWAEPETINAEGSNTRRMFEWKRHFGAPLSLCVAPPFCIRELRGRESILRYTFIFIPWHVTGLCSHNTWGKQLEQESWKCADDFWRRGCLRTVKGNSRGHTMLCHSYKWKDLSQCHTFLLLQIHILLKMFLQYQLLILGGHSVLLLPPWITGRLLCLWRNFQSQETLWIWWGWGSCRTLGDRVNRRARGSVSWKCNRPSSHF